MSEVVAIAGQSGGGKSTSIKFLDPKETYLINTAGKSLPFKGSAKLYNVEAKNYYEPNGILDTLAKLKTVSEKAPHIKQIVIDDAKAIQSLAEFATSLQTGLDKVDGLQKLVNEVANKMGGNANSVAGLTTQAVLNAQG